MRPMAAVEPGERVVRAGLEHLGEAGGIDGAQAVGVGGERPRRV